MSRHRDFALHRRVAAPPLGAATAFAALAILCSSPHADQPESVVAISEAAEPISFAYGQQTSGASISPAVDLDSYTFEGQAGDRIWVIVDGLSSNLDCKIELICPVMGIVASNSCSSTSISTCSVILDTVLENTGPYTVLVSDAGSDNPGDYRLQLERLPNCTPSPGLPYNSNRSDALATTTDLDFWRFMGVAGDLIRITVDGQSNDLDPRLVIVAPSGAVVEDAWCSASSIQTCSVSRDVSLTESGEHAVFVRDSGSDNSGSYSISLNCLIGSCPCTPSKLSTSGASEISLAAGGEQVLHIDECPEQEGLAYLLLGSTTGFTPGFQLGSSLCPEDNMPLNFDAYTTFSAVKANQAPFENTFGLLDENGDATAKFVLPPLVGLTGLDLHHAYVLFEADTRLIRGTSNPVLLTIER